MILDSYMFTNTGGRGYNEDCVGKSAITDGGVFVVADGLGGHRFGEVASKCVVDTFCSGSEPAAGEPLQKWLINRVNAAQNSVLRLQEERGGNRKSTLVALVIRGDDAKWANVGDSRLYYIHRGELLDVTEDHSVAFKKYMAGEISRDEIAGDEDQSSLLRAIGNDSRYLPNLTGIDEPLRSGDAFMLCSDGVWEYIRDNEVLIDYHKAFTAEQWAKLLLLRAMDRIKPGNDNMSIITVIVR